MIPLSIPHLNGNEWKYVKDCLDSGWVSSAGAYVTQFEQLVAQFTGAKHGVTCVNGTAGLHLSMHMLDVKLGDHVIVPNITFVASANAASYTYATPIFVDVNPDTWQLDLELLENFFRDKTYQEGQFCIYTETGKPIKAIMAVHVLGNMCDMDRLVEIGKKYQVLIVEDASESLGSYYKGIHSGNFGILSVFSFNGNKIITTGGGGVIVSNHDDLAARAKHLTTQAKSNPKTYDHDEIGFNYRLVNILAAVGVAQMEQLPEFIQKKKAIDEFYRKELKGVGDIRFQEVTDGVDPNCWLFTFRTRRQKAVLKKLEENSIIARPFWVPMNQLPMFTDHPYISEHNSSAKIHAQCLSIPSSVNLTETELSEVVRHIKSCY